MSPDIETPAMNGTEKRRRVFFIAGSAAVSATAICSPRRSLRPRKNAATPVAMSASRSTGLRRIRSSLLRTTQPLAPTSPSHVSSDASRAKWSSWTSTCSPAARIASTTTCPPRERSMKKIQGSGSRRDRGPDGIVHVVRGDAVVAGDLVRIFPRPVSANDDADGDARLDDDGLPERKLRVHQDHLRLSLGTPDEREQARRHTLFVAVDAGERLSNGLVYFCLTRARGVDQPPKLLHE